MSSDFPVHSELGTVIVGVDGSPSAKMAALWAADEAARRGQSLHLVHAADTDRRALFVRAETLQAIREAGRDLLDETAAAVQKDHPDLTVVKELSKLEPVAALSAIAGRRGTIVVANRGLGGFAALMLGSVGLGVAARATVPVIVVRAQARRRPSSVRRGRRGRQQGLPGGRRLRRGGGEPARGTTACPLGVVPLLLSHDNVAQELSERSRLLAESVAGCSERYPDVDIEQEVVRGHPVEELTRASRESLALVIGRRGHGGGSAVRLGSTVTGSSTERLAPSSPSRGPGRQGPSAPRPGPER
ncbi:uspA domain containing protein [Streptomyces laurentii]|uniref:UspA domain containing protein n=1 Tax=Streptomyces laurentii TaxID=39478 RepID=A0A160NTH1_STRLU|nr:uspA domain containing protein [Streptomyces laurentii]